LVLALIVARAGRHAFDGGFSDPSASASWEARASPGDEPLRKTQLIIDRKL
jgi:hypothetical protein